MKLNLLKLMVRFTRVGERLPFKKLSFTSVCLWRRACAPAIGHFLQATLLQQQVLSARRPCLFLSSSPHKQGFVSPLQTSNLSQPCLTRTRVCQATTDICPAQYRSTRLAGDTEQTCRLLVLKI